MQRVCIIKERQTCDWLLGKKGVDAVTLCTECWRLARHVTTESRAAAIDGKLSNFFTIKSHNQRYHTADSYVSYYTFLY